MGKDKSKELKKYGYVPCKCKTFCLCFFAIDWDKIEKDFREGNLN